MQLIVVFIILAVIFGGYFYFGQSPEQGEELSSEQLEEPIPETKESVLTKTQTFLESAEPAESTSEPSEPKSTISINTYITSGPEEGEVIEEINRVTFEFESKVSPEETEGRVIFETKIEGFDEDWKETSSKQRTINLPSGPKEYTFLVRAKINDVIDKTPAERIFKINTSPYFDKVEISSANVQTSSRPSAIRLSTRLNEEEEINITGWQIKGRRGSLVVPQGIEKYHPVYDPTASKDILIEQGDKIYLSGGLNPLGENSNFRLNKCLGYLDNYHDFPISLPKNCPKPTSEEISHLQPCCQKYILNKMSRCEVLDYWDFSDYCEKCQMPERLECQLYITNTFSYAGCFNEYSRDEDFLQKTWHIYLNRDYVSKDLDTFYLRDQNGLLVDTYTYGTLCY